jgi:hypothetical protein
MDPVTIDATQWAELLELLEALKWYAQVITIATCWVAGQNTWKNWRSSSKQDNFL